MHLRTTWADWFHDLRGLVHDPTRSSVIVRSLARLLVPLTATGRKHQSLHAIDILFLTKHSRSVVSTSNRQKSHDQKIVRSGVTKALLSPHKPSCSLRWRRDVLKLYVQCSKRLWGDHAFSLAAPHVWNNLPFKIRAASSVNIFKPFNLLNTHLFSQ